MRIDGAAVTAPPASEVVQSLESRMPRVAPPFDGLYQQLRAMSGQGGGPAYRTVAAQLAVVLQVVQQLKADGLDEDPLYQERRGVHTRVFGLELQMKAFLQQAMNPQWDEDSREAVEW